MATILGKVGNEFFITFYFLVFFFASKQRGWLGEWRRGGGGSVYDSLFAYRVLGWPVPLSIYIGYAFFFLYGR